ncbi:shikimate dehydrogenase [Clostridium carnis]
MEFYGLLGEKLSHSLSPKIHKLILDYIKQDGGYKLFEVERNNLKAFTDAIKVLKVKGTNVTIPYKEDIIKYLDGISEEAKRIGAINTITLKNNKLYGDNTDYYGFGYMLEAHNITIKNKIAVILGNGGACKGALQYLLDNNICKVFIVSRKPKGNIYNDDRVEIIDYKALENIKGDILINSTPVGMYPNVDLSPVGDNIIANFNILVDLIYNPTKTKFLLKGEALEKTVVGGLYMLVGQGVKAQEIWQNIKIDKSVIESIYNEISKEFK